MSEFEKDLANVMGSFIETELDCVEKQNQEIEQLKQENKQLKEKINTYENPEDLTLMYMWCNEKAKDEIKQLKDELKNEESKVKSLKVALETRTEERDKYSSKCFLYKEVIKEVSEYNNQIIKDTKDFYRPTEDTIYSGDTLIDLAETNIQILDKAKENK